MLFVLMEWPRAPMIQDSSSIVDDPEGEERRLATEEGTLVTTPLGD